MLEADLCGASQKSKDPLAVLAPLVQWQESYVTADRDTALRRVGHKRLSQTDARRIGIAQFTCPDRRVWGQRRAPSIRRSAAAGHSITAAP